MAGRDAGVLPRSPREVVPSRSRPPVVLPAVIAAEGVACAVLAGLDGSAVWQAARVLLVVVVTVWAVWFTRRAGRAGRGATALALGITGTVAGAGVGSAHLAKAGLDAAAAVAGVVLVAGVVAEGATGQQLADHGWRPHDVTGVIDRGMEWVMYTAAGLISGAPRPMSIPDAIRASDGRPTLIIAGGAVADEPVAARWFRAASPATVQVWVVPHAGHTQGLATAPRAWEAQVTGFLDAALRP